MENKAWNLRVWWMRDRKFERYSVPSIEVACGVLYGLSMSDLANPRVGMNAGGLEVLEDIGDGTGLNWNEWYDVETGMDIREWLEEHYSGLEKVE